MSVPDRLRWYGRRLTLMQPAEVATHARRAAGARADALTWNLSRRTWTRRWEPPGDRLFATSSPPSAPIGFLTVESASLLRRELPAEAAAAVAAAERRLHGPIELLGHPPFVLEADWDGATDPLSGERWPDRHGRLIDFRHGVPGDPKLTWELHRLQGIPLLVLASHLEGDDRLAREALRQMLAWFGRHPPGRGIAWANTFEPGLRALSLAVAFDGIRSLSSLDDRTKEDLLRGLWQHGSWIEAGLSRYSSANNHLIGELLGLLAVGLLAPELADSGRWASRAAAELSEQAELQVLGDGAGAEQAFGYSMFVADLLLVAVALFRARGLDAPAAVARALDRIGDALALLLDGDEPEPTFGDGDQSRALVLDGADIRTGREIAAALAACRGHRGARRVARGPDATAIQLFGEAGARTFAETQPAAEAGSGVLARPASWCSGSPASASSSTQVPLGYLSIAAHGHADALSIALSAGSDDLVVDPGTGSYLDVSVREWFRGTGAHATVTVDDRDQSQQGGAFIWLRQGNARLLEWDAGRLVAIAEHDGYRRLADPVTHRRAVARIGERALLVVDRLEGCDAHTAAQNWPLHPNATVAERSPGLLDASFGGDRHLLLGFAATRESTVTHDRAGLWSGRLGQWEPAPRCRQHVSWEGVVHLAALIVVGGFEEEPPAVRLEESGGQVVAHTTVDGYERALALRLTGAGAPGVGPVG